MRITPLQAQLSLREDPKHQEIAELFQQALAWEVKCLTDEERWDQVGAEAGSSLLIDAALGRRLLDRLGVVLEQWGHRGSMEDRQLLLAMRGEIARRLDRIFTLVDGAEQQLPRLVARIEQWESQAARSSEPPPPRPAPKRREPRRDFRRGRGWILAAALTVAGLALFVGMNASSWYNRPPAGDLALRDFASVPMIRAMEDRPPSVFIVVDQGAWRRLTPTQKNEVVAHVREIIRGQGYEGALFSTDGGAVVAQWTSREGTVIFPGAAAEAAQAGL